MTSDQASFRPRRIAAWRRSLVCLGLAISVALALPPAARAELGAGSLLIAGTQLTVSPESQTVPFNTPTIVATKLEGFDPDRGTLPPDLRVVGDLSGPEISGTLRLETRPGEPFRIPRFSLDGEYVLDDIRLVRGDRLLAYAAPRSAVIRVTQILITHVTSRALTLDEIRSRGIVISGDNFKAFNFTFGFTVEGRQIDYDVPILWRPHGDPAVLLFGPEGGSAPARFQPPQLAPFVLDLMPEPDDPMPMGGCLDPSGDCTIPDPPPLPGVILFPTDSSLLHQFFAVVLMVQNGAPAGDPLVVRYLTAKITLPSGLRAASTEPPTPLGAPVPVHVPGPDGKLGTADDLTFLIAQAMGDAEFLVEGLREGTHVVSIELDGILDGLPTGIRRIGGTARGAVLVRDPRFAIHISHPDVIRRSEEYTLRLTVSNVSNAPANLLSIGLPASALAGVELVDPSQFRKTIETLLPGESESVEFRLRALRTGRVTASAARSDASVTPTFDLRVGVGETGIPFSPNSILLSRSSESLPASLVESALDLAGLGLSLAEAPAASLSPDLPQVGRAAVDQRVWQLAQAGRHVTLGEELFDSSAVLAAEWLGARDADWDWDQLRRTTKTGGRFVHSLAGIFGAEIAAHGAEAAFERFASTTAFLPPLGGVLATGGGVRLDLSSRTSGRHLISGGPPVANASADLRDLPFADLLHVPTGEWALLGVPEEGGYRARLGADRATTLDLQILATAPGPQLLALRFRDVALDAGGVATVEWTPAGAADAFLSIDRDGDGDEDARIPAHVEVVQPRRFEMVTAVQNARVDPTGHVVDVLFSGDVDLGSLYPADPTHFEIQGKLSNGGAIPTEQNSYLRPPLLGGEPVHRNPFEGLRDTRVVQVVFNNPLSPYLPQLLTAGGIRSVLGESAVVTHRAVRTTVTMPGGLVEGRVIGPDGAPLAFALVSLTESDLDIYTGDCVRHTTAAVRTDALGAFLFDYVRQTECGAPFELTAKDPASDKRGKAAGRIRFVGNRLRLDIVLLGRGKIMGTARYDDGTVPRDLTIIGYSPVFKEGRTARIDAAGNYDIGDLPVGTISLSATAGDGSFVLATVAIPTSGATVVRDLVLLRRPEAPTGELRGTVFETDGTTPVVQAFVAVYVDGKFITVRRTDFDGGFDFGVLPAGLAEIEAFSAETGRAGARIFFDILPDRVNDVRVLLVDERGVVEGHVYRRTLTGIVPVAGAVVYASQTPFHTMTDASGAYRLENVFAGFREVRAVDLATNQQVGANVNVRDGAIANLDLYFEENTRGSIAGVIRDRSGAALGGATIHLTVSGGQVWTAEAVADAMGMFAFPSVNPGTYDVHGYRGGDGAVARVTVRFAGDSVFADLRVRRGTIRGSVRAQNGSGAPIGVIAVARYRTTIVRQGLVLLDLESHDIVTQTDGTFEIPNVLAGNYSATISNAFYGTRSFSGAISIDGQVATHDVLFEQNGRITGTIFDQDGVTPVENALVRVVHPNYFHNPAGYEVHSGPGGRFIADLIPPTPNAFPLDVSYDNGTVHRKARVWVRFTQFGQQLDVPIVLLKQAAVRGRVEDANGVLIPRADVLLRGAQFPDQELRQQTDDGGAFSFTNVFEGPVTITATAPGLGGLSGKTATAVVAEGADVEGVVVRLEPTGEIRGHLRSPIDGSAVSGASVILVRFGKLLDSATSDDQGGFTFRLLPLAPYRIEASDPRTGRQGRKENLLLTTNGQVIDTDLVLEARGEVVGHLSDPTTNVPVPGASILLYSTGIVAFNTYSSTDAQGAFEFLGVPQGHFTLLASEPGGRRRAMGAGAIATEGERVVVELALDPQGVVFGSVLRPLGQPAGLFSPSNVVVIQGAGRIAATLDNPFRFEGVIVGIPFTLIVTEPGGDHIGKVTSVVTAAGQELRVDVPMQSVATVEIEVVNGAGTPVGGVEVRGLTKMVALNSPQMFGNGVVNGTTNAQGIVTFPRLLSGSIDAYAYDPVSRLRGAVSGTIDLDGVTTRLRLMLEPSGTVKGRFVNSDGVTPAAGVLVVLTALPGSFFSTTLRQAAAEDGSFSFPAPLGIFTIDATQSLGPGRYYVFGRIETNGQVFDFGTRRLDDESPSFLSVEPANGAIGVPVAQAIRIRFTEPVQPLRLLGNMASLERVSADNAGQQVIPVEYTFADGGATLVLAPVVPLDSDRRYRVTVYPENILDHAGRGLTGGRVTSYFNTADVIAPSVVSVSPVAGAIQVAVNAVVRLVFSEPLGAASLDGSPFQLFDQTIGAGVSTGFGVANGGREVVLTPLAALAAEHTFEVRAIGVRDPSGNVMPSFASTFIAVDSTVPILSLSAPANVIREVPFQLVATPVASPDIALVRFYRADQLLGTVNAPPTAPPFTWVYSPTAADAAAGTVTLSTEAVDRSGNVGPRAFATAAVDPNAPSKISISTLPATEVGVAGLLGITATLSDSNGITSWSILVSGGVTQTFDSGPISGTSFLASRTLTLPIQPPTSTVEIRVRLVDGLGTEVVSPPRMLTILPDTVPPSLTISTPRNGDLVLSGAVVSVTTNATDAVRLATVTLRVPGAPDLVRDYNPFDARYTFTFTAPQVTGPTPYSIEVEARDLYGNVTTNTLSLVVSPNDTVPPRISFVCPAPSEFDFLYLVPAQRLHVVIDAADPSGIVSVSTSGDFGSATDTTAPYEFNLTYNGTRTFGGQTFEAIDRFGNRSSLHRSVIVVQGAAVLAANETLGGERPNPYSESIALVVPNGKTLTIDGVLDLASLLVADGGKVVVSPATGTEAISAELYLFGEGSAPSVWVACQGAIDASGRGYLGGGAASQSSAGAPGRGVDNDPTEGAPAGTGGSHGGRGGSAIANSEPLAGAPFDSPYQPMTPGGGGGGGASANGTAGGGVLFIYGSSNEMVIDGSMLANGASGAGPTGAGGSIAIQGSVRGAGRLEASGGASTSNGPTGGGGRIALFGLLEPRFRDRAIAAGGAAGATTPSAVGGAGTIYHFGSYLPERNPDGTPAPLPPTGTLIIDNAGRITANTTVLPSVGMGLVTAFDLDLSQFTDAAADFRSSQSGGLLQFGTDYVTAYGIGDHPHHADTLGIGQLDFDQPPATIEPGVAYRGLVRLDRLIVRGGAWFDPAARCEVLSTSVDALSQLHSDCTPPVGLATPLPDQRFLPEETVTVRLAVRDDVTLTSATFDNVSDEVAPFEWTFVAMDEFQTVAREIAVDAVDDHGVHHVLRTVIFLDTAPRP